MEDILLGEMGITECGKLHPFVVDEIHRIIFLKPSFTDRFLIEAGARIRGGQRDLNGMRIDVFRELDGLLDRLLGLARQSENECPMDRDVQFTAVLGESAGNIRANPLFDIEQDLIIAGLVADQEQAKPIILS